MPEYYGISLRPPIEPGERILSLFEPEVDARVLSPAIIANVLNAENVDLFIPHIDAMVSAPSVLAEGFNRIVLGLEDSRVYAYVMAPSLLSGDPADLNIDLTEPQVSALVSELPIETSGLVSINVPLANAEVDAIVSNVSIVTNALGAITVSLFESEIDANVSAPPIETQAIGAINVAHVDAEIDALVAAPSISVGTIGDVEVDHFEPQVEALVLNVSLAAGSQTAITTSLYIPEVDALVSNVAVSTGSQADITVDLDTPEVDARVSLVTLSIGSAADIVVGGYPGQVDAKVLAVSLSAAGATDLTVTHYEPQVEAKVLTLPIVTEAAGTDTVAHYEAHVDAKVLDVEITQGTPPPTTNDAACFQANGYMYSVPGAFAAYQPSIENGYISAWFKFTDNEANWLNTHRMAIWSVLNDELDTVNVGVGRIGPSDYADMYIERRDYRPEARLWTWMDAERDDARPFVNLYDGNWHHLVWGHENPGVTNPDGWYFFADGIRLGLPGYRDEDQTVGPQGWFESVQAPDARHDWLNDINVAASRLEGGWDWFTYACLDEIMVVNTRTINDRGGTSGEVEGDVAWLYNGGNGRLISEVESINPNNLWNYVYNAYPLDQPEPWLEVKNPTGANPPRHNLPNIVNLTQNEGIPGGV